MNFTGKRFDMLKEAGYKLRKIHYCKVAAYVGTTTIFVWVKNDTREDTIVTWNNFKWESDDVYKQKKVKRVEREKKKLNKPK